MYVMDSPGGLKPGSCGLQWTDNYTPMQTYYIQHNSLSQPPTTQTHPQSNCTNPGLYQPQATATVAHIILTLAAHAGPVDEENTCTPGIQILHNDPSKISNRLESGRVAPDHACITASRYGVGDIVRLIVLLPARVPRSICVDGCLFTRNWHI